MRSQKPNQAQLILYSLVILSCLIFYRYKIKTGTLTPIITKLEGNGYLERIKDEKDDRKIYISITQKGLELEEKAKDIPKKLACNIELKEEEYLKYLKDFNDLVKKLDYIGDYIK